MYGWRARIGLLLPSDNVVVESEFSKILPEGMLIHGARMYAEFSTTVEGIKMMNKNVEKAVREIKSVNLNCVAYCCTSGSFYKGKRGNNELLKMIQTVAKVPATTTSTSSVLALKKLNLNKISIATPYIKEINKRAGKFFEEHGFKVMNITGMNIERGVEIGSIIPIEVYRFARESFDDKADGLFISCTNLRTFEVIQPLEKGIGKPVVTANQATFWRSLKIAGVNEKITGYGELLEKG
jgi:maleate isomerase